MPVLPRDLLHATARVWFRYEIHGLDRIPDPPCIFVGNHSGIGIAEILCMLAAWDERFGATRPIHGLAHDFLFKVPLLRDAVRAIGGIPASWPNAREALEQGRDVLVFPGGELDACRPFYESRSVVFGDRRGYIELARAARAPIVPVATIGSHLTYVLVPGGALVARALGLRSLLRLERVPLPAGLLAGLAALPFDAAISLFLLAVGLVPNPVPIASHVLDAIEIPDTASVEEAHRAVHGALQEAVSRLPNPGRKRVSRDGRHVGARTKRTAA